DGAEPARALERRPHARPLARRQLPAARSALPLRRPRPATMTSSSRARQERERAFYRSGAAGLEPERMPPGALHEFDLSVIDRLGDVGGRRLLEVGCGSGDVTLEL